MTTIPTIDDLTLPPPQLGDDRETFNLRFDSLLGDLPTVITQINDTGDAMEEAVQDAINAVAGSVVGTSTSSVTIGTGAKSFVTQADKNWVATATWVVVASAANPLDFMYGYVTSYAAGVLTITVPANGASGSGTHSDWVISVTAPPQMARATTQIGSSIPTTSGTQWGFTSIPSFYSKLYLLFEGVSVSATANVTVSMSGNNFGIGQDISSLAVANGILPAAGLYGLIVVQGYTLPAGRIDMNVGQLQTSDYVSSASTFISHSLRHSAGLNAIRINTSAGTFDAGAIHLFGV